MPQHANDNFIFLFQFFHQFFHNIKQVFRHAVMGHIKDGRILSELMAMIVDELFIPSMCSGAPEIPNAIYTFGFTFIPDFPTW
jgi:hypothetical protein